MSRRIYALTAAALAASVGLALMLAGAGGGSTAGPPAAEIPRAAAPKPDGLFDQAEAEAGRLLELDAPAGAYPVIWPLPGKSVPVRTEPGGGKVAEIVRRRTDFGSPSVLGVVRTRGEWAAVTTPAVANDEVGWVRLDSRRLRASWTEQSIVVDLSERRAVLREGDRKLLSFTVTIGAPGSDTPIGRFSVTDTFRGDLNPVYGCCAVATTAFQPDLPSGWLGGNRIAFHGNGTGGPLGVAASNGCLRADDADVSALVDRVGLGAPVFIRE